MGDPICPFSNDDLAANPPLGMPDEITPAMPLGHEGNQDFAEKAPGRAPETRGQNPSADRRRRRRVLISAPLRVRNVDLTNAGPDEISTTIDVSRGGLLFVTSRPTYCRGMEVMVTFPYSKTPTAIHAEQRGRVARVFEMPDGRRAVALALGPTGIGELVDSGGRKLNGQQNGTGGGQTDPKPPLVVAMDSDPCVRETLKAHLMSEGYDVIAVNNPADAREVLNVFTPALVIAEIEGDDLPGYALCAHVKGTPRLQRVPVVLTTSSAYPSDYSSAHSLGAIVCMAKPYKQERLSHIVRLLAPLQAAKLNSAPARPADPSRKPGVRASKRSDRRQGPDSSGPGFWPFRLGK